MGLREDLLNNIETTGSITPAAHTASVNGGSADLQDAKAAIVHWHVGTVTDGTHTPKLQDSADNSTWADVAAANLDGTFAALASNTDQKIGYIGGERYLRAVSTVAGATTGGVYEATILGGKLRKSPA